MVKNNLHIGHLYNQAPQNNPFVILLSDIKDIMKICYEKSGYELSKLDLVVLFSVVDPTNKIYSTTVNDELILRKLQITLEEYEETLEKLSKDGMILSL